MTERYLTTISNHHHDIRRRRGDLELIGNEDQFLSWPRQTVDRFCRREIYERLGVAKGLVRLRAGVRNGPL